MAREKPIPAPTRAAPPYERRIKLRAAADRTGMHHSTLRRYVGDGRLSAWRIGPKTIFLDVAEVDALWAQVPTVGSAA